MYEKVFRRQRDKHLNFRKQEILEALHFACWCSRGNHRNKFRNFGEAYLYI